MTATTPDPGADMLADLSRSYQRASRCVRQTLALRAKLAQEAVVHRIRTTPSPIDGWMARARESIQEEAQFERLKVLQNAVSRLIDTEFSDATIRADYIEALDGDVDGQDERPGEGPPGDAPPVADTG